jgi:pilus assembly protein CpaC
MDLEKSRRGGEAGSPAVRAARLACCALAGLLVAAAAGADPGAPSIMRLSTPQSPADAIRELHLERNKSLYVTTEYTVRRVSVGDPTILDVVVLSPRELQFVPKAIGHTNVVIWDPRGTPQAALEVSVGTTHSNIESDLRRVLGAQDIRVDSAGESIVLTGSVPNALVAEQAVDVTQAMFGKKGKDEHPIINLLEVGGGQQVMIEVVLAEMARSWGREIGSNFTAALSNGDVRVFSFVDHLSRFPSSTTENGQVGGLRLSDAINLIGLFTTGSGNTYTLLLDVLEENGIAKVLARPNLVARSGETASFLSGGEIPIPIVQSSLSNSITVEFKEFGVGVSFTPTVLAPGRIHLKVAPEASQPDFSFGTSVSGTTVPAFITRKASTSIELGDGETFAIAGLLNEQVNEMAAKYPILGDIPVLGALFSSRKFQKNESELVILVTPRLVKPLGPGPHPLPTDNFIEPDGFEFYLLGRIEGAEREGPPASGAPPNAYGAIPAPMQPAAPAVGGGLIGSAGHRVAALPEENL